MHPTLDMQISPHDRAPAPAPPSFEALSHRPSERWVPSRFNARTVGDDGRLLLWNTLTGAMNIFPDSRREAVVSCLAPGGVPEPLDATAHYLGTRGYLVPGGIDEVDRFRVAFAREQWRSDKLEFVLMASEDCNFRCVYCYEKFERGTMTPETRAGVRALTLARAPRLSFLNVGWFGGEPLYGWDAVEELSPFFRDVAARHGIAQTQHMTTNGYLLTEERATRLLEWGCRDFQITLDGVPQDHDCKRVGRDGSSTHAVILDNLRSLKARDGAFVVVVRVNYDRDNFPRLGPFIEALSEDFGGDPRFRMRFRAVGRWGGANDDALNVCGVEHRDVQRALQQKADDLGLAREGGIMEVRRPGSQVCYAARPYHLIVGAAGTLMKCTIALYDLPENVVGHLHADGSMEMHDDNLGRWVKPQFESDAMCRKCYLLPTCQGAECPLTRITRNQRTCCRVKASLKDEMRYTLSQHRSPAAGAA